MKQNFNSLSYNFHYQQCATPNNLCSSYCGYKMPEFHSCNFSQTQNTVIKSTGKGTVMKGTPISSKTIELDVPRKIDEQASTENQRYTHRIAQSGFEQRHYKRKSEFEAPWFAATSAIRNSEIDLADKRL